MNKQLSNALTLATAFLITATVATTIMAQPGGGRGPGGPGGPGGGGFGGGPGGSGGFGGGPGGPGGPRSTPYTLSGVYTLDGGTATLDNKTYISNSTDVSAVYVKNGGNLTLNNPTITTTGNTSNEENSSFYGLNAGVLAATRGKITINGGTITTSGSGANGAFASGAGSSITLSKVTIKCTGPAGHGVEAAGGGTLTLTDCTITTTDRNGAAIATDRGSGTITVTGGTATSSGTDSPAIYSTGKITATGLTASGTGAEAAVIEGANSITLTDCTLSGAKKCGIMIYQSFSGDAEGRRGNFTMTNGSFTAEVGPLFYITNTTGIISLKNTKLTATSGELLKASSDRWGRSGQNGGHAELTADTQTLTGNVTVDAGSSATLILKNNSALTGTVTGAALSLDATSKWTLSADSTITTLSNAAGLSGTTFTNITGNGHTVKYKPKLAANAWLAGKTYTLTGGGTLAPAD